MSSLAARAFGLFTALLVRRRDWGPPRASTRASTRRTILYLHGGGYVSCSPATHRPITAAFARLTPAVVYAPDYPLAPEHPYPAALDAAERAYGALLAQGVDPRTLVVAGDPAGGGLTLALLFRLRDKRLPMPAGAVVLSPWTDVTGSLPSVRANDGRCAMFRPENMPAFAACYAPRARWTEPEVSPRYGRFDRLPPLHVQVGDDELLRDDAARVHEAALAAGGASELRVVAGVFHGWQMLDGIVPESRRSLRDAAAFIRAATPTPNEIASMSNDTTTPQHRWLRRLVGEWTYETDPMASPGGGAPVAYRGTEHARLLGDVWLVLEQRQTEPAESPGTALITLGYDPARERVVGAFVTSMMPSLWIYEGTLDEAGGVLTLETEGPSFTKEGETGRYRDVLTVESDDARTFTSHYLDDDGAWQAFMTMRLRRTA